MGVTEKRPPGLGLVRTADLDGVVRRCRPEPFTPFRLAVVAVCAGVSEDVDTVVPYLQRKGIGMRMRRDGQESMGPAVATAPDFRTVLSARTQQHEPGIGEPTGLDQRSRKLMRPPQRADQMRLDATGERR